MSAFTAFSLYYWIKLNVHDVTFHNLATDECEGDLEAKRLCHIIDFNQ